MSDEYLRLVAGLTPPGRRYQVNSATEPRARFVLFALAYLADDDGRCTVSLTDLAALTLLSTPALRNALRELEQQHGLVRMSRNPSQPNTYRLDRAGLEAHQYSRRLRTTTPTVDLLAEYGLDSRTINALYRAGLSDLGALGTRIAAYQRHKVPDKLHVFLGIPGFGERSGRRLLDSYAAWTADPTT